MAGRWCCAAPTRTSPTESTWRSSSDARRPRRGRCTRRRWPSGAFGPADEQRLWALAALVGAAVRQARLAAEGQRLAVVEERQKLARELHDSVTQSLFSASLLAQAAQSLWGRDPQKAKERL